MNDVPWKMRMNDVHLTLVQIVLLKTAILSLRSSDWTQEEMTQFVLIVNELNRTIKEET